VVGNSDLLAETTANVARSGAADIGNFLETSFGWGAWIRTREWRYQKPLPYRLATPQ
jgi:hypothetical protein